MIQKKDVKRWFLKRKGTDNVVAYIEEDEDHSSEVALVGTAYTPSTWDHKDNILEADFHSEFYLKWDSCTHWYFRGEEYDDKLFESDSNSYYHLCGAYCFDLHMIVMAFVWEVAKRCISRFDHNHIKNDTIKYYDESKFASVLLEDYEIVEGE